MTANEDERAERLIEKLIERRTPRDVKFAWKVIKEQTRFTDIELTATVEFTCSVLIPSPTAVEALYRRDHCSVCEALMPTQPDFNDPFVIAYMMAGAGYDSDGRIAFPVPENAECDRERFPIRGWRQKRTNGQPELLCPNCYTAIKEAADAVRAARSKKP